MVAESDVIEVTVISDMAGGVVSDPDTVAVMVYDPLPL